MKDAYQKYLRWLGDMLLSQEQKSELDALLQQDNKVAAQEYILNHVDTCRARGDTIPTNVRTFYELKKKARC